MAEGLSPEDNKIAEDLYQVHKVRSDALGGKREEAKDALTKELYSGDWPADKEIHEHTAEALKALDSAHDQRDANLWRAQQHKEAHKG